MVDTCDFSWQPELGAKQPIRSSFTTNRSSFCRTSSHPTFPSALEISNDPGEWNVSCDLDQTWTGHLHGDLATSSRRNNLASRYHEPRQEAMQGPASSLSFLKQDFGSHGASQGSAWEMDYLRQMNENRIARQERSRCNSSAAMSNSRMRDSSYRIVSAPPIESFSYQRNTDTPLRNQNPANTESFRYRRSMNTPLRDQSPSNGAQRYGQSRGTKAQSHSVKEGFKAQPRLNHERSIVPSIEPTWTPIDKRARQVRSDKPLLHLVSTIHITYIVLISFFTISEIFMQEQFKDPMSHSAKIYECTYCIYCCLPPFLYASVELGCS